MIKGLAHTAYTVRDMDDALAFYCGILGFQKAFELNSPDGTPWIVYLKVAKGQFIELFYGGKNKPGSVSDEIGYGHLCLEVDDIEKIAAHIKKNGVALDSEPAMGMDTNLQCWVRDPDGNRIELMQYSRTSPQMNA